MTTKLNRGKMALNVSKGNMYEFVTHTWNTVKGECPHNCSYCYMAAMRRRYNKGSRPARFDEKELKTNLGSGNFIFVGSSNDLFAGDIPEEWIMKTLDHCNKFDNRYLFQSKNPARIMEFVKHPIFKKSVACTTLESDMVHLSVMGTTPEPIKRAQAMERLSLHIPVYITVEPILNFRLTPFTYMIQNCNPVQVNVGADTGHNHLPEPTKEEILELIAELSEFTTVSQKSNLKRILK